MNMDSRLHQGAHEGTHICNTPVTVASLNLASLLAPLPFLAPCRCRAHRLQGRTLSRILPLVGILRLMVQLVLLRVIAIFPLAHLHTPDLGHVIAASHSKSILASSQRGVTLARNNGPWRVHCSVLMAPIPVAQED